MQENFKKGRDYLWRNQAELKKGVDYISQYAEYKNDKLAQKRFEYGLALVGVAVLGITLVISTAGAGAPLVFTGIAGACDVGLVCEGVQDTYYGAIKDIETPSINPVRDYAGATYIGADSTAKTIEGIQEIYYGLNNDFETPSFNGVRDGIFRGNQKYYDTANLIIYSCFQCTGSYKNIYTAGSKALENGASAELAKITASGEEMFKAGVGSLADFTGEKLAKSCSDDMLAQFVIQTTFSFGVQKGTDKAAKSFGVGFSNKMSKYVGKAGTTSTISGPKIGDANIDMPETFKVKEPEVHSESPMFGEDWNKYFQDKYDSKNVSWESNKLVNKGVLNKTKESVTDTVVKGTQQTLKKYYKIDEGKLTETNKQKLVVDMKKIYDDADKCERGDVLVPENSKDVNSVYYNQYIDKYDVSYNWKDIDTVIETRKMEILKEGQQFDRVGPPTGRCTGAVGEDGSCASVKERSIPYHFNEKNITEEPSYHRYVVEQDFTEENLSSAIENSMYSDDKKIKMQENLKEYYRRSRDKGYGDGDGLATGIIAPMFEETTGATGGGTQYDMPFNMKELEEIGMITEVSKDQY